MSWALDENREEKSQVWESGGAQGEKASPGALKHSQEAGKAGSVEQLKENHPPPQANQAEPVIS